MKVAVAIDGPVGAGKSTIARQCAKELGFIYVDTGALYRCIGLYCLNKGISTTDNENVTKALSEIKLDISVIDSTQHVFLNGVDVSAEIRQNEVSMAASNVSAIPKVREFLLDLQRGLAKSNNVIMDGRDIGTVILPDARVKIYLTAKPEIRAKRRYDELIAKGQQVEYQSVLDDLNQRDYNDMHRETAPLKAADDAVVIDTSELNFNEACEVIIKTIKDRAGI